MQWYKSYLPKDIAQKTVMEYEPLRFELGTPNQALEYLKNKQQGSDFVMSDATKMQTGIDKVEDVTQEEKIEQAAIEKLKSIQEQAYQEAYALGLDEGRKQAFKKNAVIIEEKLNEFDKLLVLLGHLKSEMVLFNESHLMKLLFHMSEKLARIQIQQDPKIVLEIMKSAVQLAQSEEKIVVSVAPSQLEFLEELKNETGREFEFMKKVQLVPSQEVTEGGCIVETNYGEIDSRFEQRLEQLWLHLSDNLPKVKDRIAG